jgi:2,4-dienoyl-CoA reductase (NADPH2)
LGSSPPAEGRHALFPHLFSPFKLRGLAVRNRTVMLPMGSRFARDGQPTDGDVAFYKTRARAGVGTIITGGTPMHESGAFRGRNAYEGFNRASIPGFARLAGEIHAGGAAVFGQLYHRGRETLGDSEWPTWAPSAIPSPVDPQVPHEMSASEIGEIVDGFGRSAANLREAGFDGIEIHGAHGYLVAQFLSPLANRREDAYGGTFENRMRFLIEIIDSIRGHVDQACVLGLRMSADEGVEGGLRPADSARIAAAVAATGHVDYLSVTMGIRGSYVQDMSAPAGLTIPLAAQIRAASGLPVLVGQRINHPSLAESALASGAADLVGTARALIADGEWVAKAQAGRIDEIRPCIACVQDCRSGGMACVHNASAGREMVWGPVLRAGRRRKVVVVGGGPAGMEAAVQAAERGHDVVLFEAAAQLGGQVRIAALAPTRGELDGVVSYRASELRRLGVSVRLGVTAGREAVLAEKPDVVVLGTGARPSSPPAGLAGADLPHVWDVFEALAPVAAREAMLEQARYAVVVDDGSGFWESSSVAEALATRGLAVTLMSPARTIGASLPAEAAGPFFARFASLGGRLAPMSRLTAVEPGRLRFFNIADAETPADIVVIYSGKQCVTTLAEELAGAVPEIHLVGDMLSPRRITQAVFDGHRIGRSL